MAGVAGTESPTLALPVLGKFWYEDGVWNGVAEDMAVAVFGKFDGHGFVTRAKLVLISNGDGTFHKLVADDNHHGHGHDGHDDDDDDRDRD